MASHAVGLCRVRSAPSSGGRQYAGIRKSPAAWETAARCATLAQEADEPQEREHYTRLGDAWITLAKRCELFNFTDVTNAEK
jgi:hypothetical protein